MHMTAGDVDAESAMIDGEPMTEDRPKLASMVVRRVGAAAAASAAKKALTERRDAEAKGVAWESLPAQHSKEDKRQEKKRRFMSGELSARQTCGARSACTHISPPHLSFPSPHPSSNPLLPLSLTGLMLPNDLDHVTPEQRLGLGKKKKGAALGDLSASLIAALPTEDDLRQAAAEEAARATAAIANGVGAAQEAAAGGMDREERDKLAHNERRKFGLVLAHPVYRADPVAAIREHLQNEMAIARARDSARAAAAAAASGGSAAGTGAGKGASTGAGSASSKAAGALSRQQQHHRGGQGQGQGQGRPMASNGFKPGGGSWKRR